MTCVYVQACLIGVGPVCLMITNQGFRPVAIRFAVSSVLTVLASAVFASFGVLVSDPVQVANAQALTLLVSSGDAAVAGTRDVILFDGENQDGHTRRWSLPAGQPYRFVS